MLDTIKRILEVQDIPLLLSWSFALFMVIGSTIELRLSDMRKGLLCTLAFILAQSLIKERIVYYSVVPGQELLAISPNVITTILLLVSIAGLAVGKMISMYVTRENK